MGATRTFAVANAALACFHPGMRAHRCPAGVKGLLPSYLFAIGLLCSTLLAADSSPRVKSVEIDAPFGKADMAVVLRHDHGMVLFYVSISKPMDSPAIQQSDLKVQVRDQHGRPIVGKPIVAESGPLVEISMAGAVSATAIYTLTLEKDQQPKAATVTWLGVSYDFPAMEWWDEGAKRD